MQDGHGHVPTSVRRDTKKQGAHDWHHQACTTHHGQAAPSATRRAHLSNSRDGAYASHGPPRATTRPPPLGRRHGATQCRGAEQSHGLPPPQVRGERNTRRTARSRLPHQTPTRHRHHRRRRCRQRLLRPRSRCRQSSGTFQRRPRACDAWPWTPGVEGAPPCKHGRKTKPQQCEKVSDERENDGGREDTRAGRHSTVSSVGTFPS